MSPTQRRFVVVQIVGALAPVRVSCLFSSISDAMTEMDRLAAKRTGNGYFDIRPA
jgi:hypothetical protein